VNSNTDFSQSPVNISTTVAATPTDTDIFFYNYPAYESPVTMVNDGRFLYTVLPNDDGKIRGFALGQSYPNHLTEEYYIYKMLVHTPSEHTYNGAKVPLELQLFHRKKDAELTDGEPSAADTAVVAIGFEESRDEASPFLRSLIDGGLPDQRGGTTLDNRAHPSILQFSTLFKPVFGPEGEEAGFWDYTGSLTQPPCSGGVRWFIRQEPMNAKKATIKLFTDSVKKSSGGVPGNARELQIIGTRPVFPRFAKTAVHMTVFEPEEPAAFADAYKRVKEHQDAFKESLNAGSGGSAEAIADGKDAEDSVLASNDYKSCLSDLGTLTADLEMAKTKQQNDCNTAEGYQKTMEDIAGGPARIEAAQKGASAQKSCDDQTLVVEAKEGQKTELESQCNTIKSNVEKEVEAAALAKANATADASA